MDLRLKNAICIFIFATCIFQNASRIFFYTRTNLFIFLAFYAYPFAISQKLPNFAPL